MSEWRDFLESAELTDRQKRIYDMVCDLHDSSNNRDEVAKDGYWSTFDHLKQLLIEEFTGVRIV